METGGPVTEGVLLFLREIASLTYYHAVKHFTPSLAMTNLVSHCETRSSLYRIYKMLTATLQSPKGVEGLPPKLQGIASLTSNHAVKHFTLMLAKTILVSHCETRSSLYRIYKMLTATLQSPKGVEGLPPKLQGIASLTSNHAVKHFTLSLAKTN